MKLQPIIDKNLFEEVLIKPAKWIFQKKLFDPPEVSLHIVSGYAKADMAIRHRNELGIPVIIHLVVGMMKSPSLDLDELTEKVSGWRNPDFRCRKSSDDEDHHAKVYVWYENGVPTYAFCGSANYSLSAFGLKCHVDPKTGKSIRRIEAMVRTDPIPANLFFEKAWSKGQACPPSERGEKYSQ